MAISTGKDNSKLSFKRYTGVGTVEVLAVCPNKETLGVIQGREVEVEPVYITTGTDENGKTFTNAMISVVIQTVDKGISLIHKANFFVRNVYAYNKERTKVKVIDSYAQTAWVTKEELKNKAIPQYKNGPASIDKDYRPMYEGEEAFTLFIKNLLNIPNARVYDRKTSTWSANKNLSECECRLELEQWNDIFHGKFDEIRSIITSQPNNKVKMLFGIKTNQEGKQFQDVYLDMTLKEMVLDYSKLEKEVKERKANGGLGSYYFEFGPIHEYTPQATTFPTEDPVDGNNESAAPFEPQSEADDMPW